MKLRVGLVGLGEAWEALHRPALRALDDRFEVRAVCANVARRAEKVATEFDACAMDGYQAMTARCDIDAILMLSPDWYGPLPILAACENGKAVYCAAALDIAPERVLEIKDRVDQSGVAFMAEFPRRQAPATLRLMELIVTRLGRPRLLFCHHRMRPIQNGRPRYGETCSSMTRLFMELADWCCYVVGEKPNSVKAICHGHPNTTDEIDYQMMSLDFSAEADIGRGALAQISIGQYIPPTWQDALSFRTPAELQVCCERGVAFVDLPNTLIWFDEAGQHSESLERERPAGEQLLSQFHRAVTSLVRNTSDMEDAFRALRVLSSAQQSMSERRRIDLG